MNKYNILTEEQIQRIAQEFFSKQQLSESKK